MRRFIVLAAFLVASLALVPVTAEAQTGSVTGRIVTEDGRAMGGAQVSILGTSLGAITTVRGRFLILNVPVGVQTVQVRSIGYGTTQSDVTVTAGGSASITFQLGEEAIVLDELTVTTGSRAAHTTADELAVAVDIFPAVLIQQTAQVEMASALNELSPSIYFPRNQIADITSGVRPFQLRGLAPDHALVLINGKRRHATAVVNVFGGGAFPGGSGVDMNAFPTMAIGRIEVLRDGAAAQYGSDAIAGVINMGLRNTVSAPEFSITAGKYFPRDWPNDGERLDIGANWGVQVGRGVLNLTGTFSQREPTQRAGADARDQLVDGDADVVCGRPPAPADCSDVGKVITKNNQVGQPNHLWGDGEATNVMIFWNFELPVAEDDDGAQFYTFGGYSDRKDIHSGFYRRSKDNRNWPAIYPLGFLPTFDSDTRDISVVAGFNGIANDWSWDVSAQFGQNRNDNDIKNTHNASLGPCLVTACAPGRDGMLGTSDDPGIPNKTRFYAGSLENNQILVNADLSKRFEVGLPSPLTLAFGASFRNDNYKVIEGEVGSYINGFHPNQSGGIASSGSQVFAGYRPEQAADENRQNFGVYGELEANLSEQFLVSGAARFENYSDFGSTLTGKIAVRVEASEKFILRAAVATGFRAPSLSQIYYGHVSTNFRTDPNDPTNQIGFEVGEFPVSSPEARAVGSEDLVEETSRSFSAGIALTPTNNWNITIDGYLVDVDDAIVMSNNLRTDFVKNLLSNFSAEAIRFFANAIDMRAKGIDITTNYRYYFGQNRLFETMLSMNFNDNAVRNVAPGNDILDALEFNIYDESDITNFEEGSPTSRGLFKTSYRDGAFKASLGANYYGEQFQRISTGDECNGPGGRELCFRTLERKVVMDLQGDYDISDGFKLSVGVENLLDTFPTRFNTFGGIFTYRTASGMGFNGRYLWTRLSVKTGR